WIPPSTDTHAARSGPDTGCEHGPHEERHAAQWHGEQEHHGAAVHGEDLVVAVCAQKPARGTGQLQAHQQRQHPAQHEECDGSHSIAARDRLVIRTRQPASSRPPNPAARPGGIGVARRAAGDRMRRDSSLLPPATHRPWPPPRRPWVMTQTWERLLFAHWPLPVEALGPLVPSDLTLETFH